MIRPALLRPLSLLAILLLSIVSCRRQEVEDSFRYRGPLLLVGVDGMEWDFMIPLLRRGKLPNIAALMQAGVFGQLQTTRPTFSPIIWTSIATGKTADQHGIQGFVRRTRETGAEKRLYDQRDRKTKAFWDIFSDYERRVAVVGWWMTHPVEPVRGVMVAQAHTLDQARRKKGRAILKGGILEGVKDQVYPPDRGAEFLQINQAVSQELPRLTSRIFGDFPHPLTALTQRLWDNTQWAFRSDATYTEITRRLAAEEFDLIAVYFGGTDVVGHRFLRYDRPEKFADRPSLEQIENFGSVIRKYYQYVDHSIGQILDEMPQRRAVLIMSDHGMKPTNVDQIFNSRDLPSDINSGHHHRAPSGVVIAAGSGFRKGESPASLEQLRRSKIDQLGSILDMTPTLLAYFGVPLGEDMTGKPMATLLTPPLVEPRTVASHDDARWLEKRNSQEGIASPPDDQDKRLEQLRALGYIE